MKRAILFLAFAFLLFSGVVFVDALSSSASTASYVTRQTAAPSFQVYYSDSAGTGLGSRLQTYWPVLDDPEQCEARQDIILQIAPNGCTPSVVRSDLLAEQNVPVFCQIDALKINPLLDIKDIENIRFVTSNKSKEIVGTGFHPAKAALRTRDQLLGDPILNNVGYVVVVLRRNEIEKNLPDSVKVSMQAEIRYDSGNPLGIGKTNFLLREQGDSEWNLEKNQQSFWNGRFSIRLDDVDPVTRTAKVSIYSGDRKISSTSVVLGQESGNIYVPGSYCQGALQVRFDGFEDAQASAVLEVVTGNGTDRIEVVKGSRFLNDRCRVDRIVPNELTQEGGSVSVSCPGQKFALTLEQDVLSGLDVKKNFVEGRAEYSVSFSKDESYVLWKGPKDKDEFKATGSGAEKRSSSYRERVKRALQEYRKLDEAGQVGTGKLLADKEHGADADKYFTEAIESYRKVAEDFPREKRNEVEKTFGEQSLERAIDLARGFGKSKTQGELLKRYIELYPNSELTESYRRELNSLGLIDYSQASAVVDVRGKISGIRVVAVKNPKEEAKALFAWGNRNVELGVNKEFSITEINGEKTSKGKDLYFEVKKVTKDEATISTNCEDNTRERSRTLGSVSMKIGDSVTLCGSPLVLKDTESHEYARISLIPRAHNTKTSTNLTVQIGIEKRAIQLTPDETRDKIGNLNESIDKWESISKNLGKVNQGLQAACFATATTLTFKSFFTGLSGKSLARQDVMKDTWRPICKEEIATGKYGGSYDACFLEHASAIERDVNARKEVIDSVNNKLSTINKDRKQDSGFLETASVDSTGAAEDLAKEIRGNSKYANKVVKLDNGKEVKVSELLASENIKSRAVSYTQVRDIYTNLLAEESTSKFSSEYNSKGTINKALKESAQRIENNLEYRRDIINAENYAKIGAPAVMNDVQSKTRVANIAPVNNVQSSAIKDRFDSSKNFMLYRANQGKTVKGKDGSTEFKTGLYALELEKIEGGNYRVTKVLQVDDKLDYQAGGAIYKDGDVELSRFASAYNLGGAIKADKDVSYANRIKNPEVRYYETEPYKGMPAVVPVDVQNGWYAGTKQILPAFGGIGAFDASGRVTSFWLCNVGQNGLIDFEESSYGDDTCQQINLNTGQPYDVFPGLNNKAFVQRLVTKAENALREAARQYENGRNSASIEGVGLNKGRPFVGVPETSCQDFMSARECHLMFNVCDPVICPSSRCDFGGKYPVADVIQTGIIGSTLLCLPNIQEKILVPVCLSGIKAGIDGYVSVLEAHRQCLQESLDTGRLTGICDQIHSVYSCEFFWRQLAPLSKIAIPRALEWSQGQGTRGGAEYLTVQSAWQNTKQSIDYFTNSYGVNTFKAFRARSIEEAGGEFCKAFISAKLPTSFESLTQPPNPPQFHGYFSSTRFTDATIPATAQYKVFYHVFAGQDSGVSYRIFLKNPPETSYYAANPILVVESGFLSKGQTLSKTRDFTAPEGYKEMCIDINGETECGFKQVSTSFAVNYVRDEFVKNEMLENKIKTEKECVSGGVNVAALLNPNLQQAADEALNPDLYRRGIIRICSTENPASSTNPERFVEVGVCGNERVKCWLDKNSVDNAITDNNKGIRNETLSELSKIQGNNLASRGIILNEDDANAKLRDLEGKVRGIEESNLLNAQGSNTALRTIEDINTVKDKLFYNHHKAWASWLEARIKGAVAKAVLGNAEIFERVNSGGIISIVADKKEIFFKYDKGWMYSFEKEQGYYETNFLFKEDSAELQEIAEQLDKAGAEEGINYLSRFKAGESNYEATSVNVQGTTTTGLSVADLTDEQFVFALFKFYQEREPPTVEYFNEGISTLRSSDFNGDRERFRKTFCISTTPSKQSCDKILFDNWLKTQTASQLNFQATGTVARTFSLALSEAYNTNERIDILNKGAKTGYVLSGGQVFFESKSSPVGVVKKGESIELLSYFREETTGKELYDYLNGASIINSKTSSGGNIIKDLGSNSDPTTGEANEAFLD
ncbi:MAG: hypothetical protein AABW80_03605 [Nanoarchaeota archaeon]